MVLQLTTPRITRKFTYGNKQFRTQCIVNRMSEEVVYNVARDEFRIYFIDGEILNSSEMASDIEENSASQLLVKFYSKDFKVKVNYSVENDVIYKRLTIGKTNKRINYIDADVLEFSDSRDVYPSLNQKIMTRWAISMAFILSVDNQFLPNRYLWEWNFQWQKIGVMEKSIFRGTILEK